MVQCMKMIEHNMAQNVLRQAFASNIRVLSNGMEVNSKTMNNGFVK